MARDHDQPSDDEQWISQIRSTPAHTDAGPPSRELAPDPWLDAPRVPNQAQPQQPDNEPVTADDDPWGHRPSTPSAAMPTVSPPHEPAPMPVAAAESQAVPIPLHHDPAAQQVQAPHRPEDTEASGSGSDPFGAPAYPPTPSSPPQAGGDPFDQQRPQSGSFPATQAPQTGSLPATQAPQTGSFPAAPPPQTGSFPPPSYPGGQPTNAHVLPPKSGPDLAPSIPPASPRDPGYLQQQGYRGDNPPSSDRGHFLAQGGSPGGPWPTEKPGVNQAGVHQYGPPQPQAPTAPPELNQQSLIKERRGAPQSGWRKAVYRASFGGINPGQSAEEIERDALISRVRTPIRGCHKIAVVSLKGGIGKTTTTSCLGLTLAHYRGDRVVALDANPDAGTLAERLTGINDVSVRDLLDNIDRVSSFTDISRYMSLANRLQVLASDQDAEVSEAFDADQYTAVTDLLARYYNVILTDSGTGMLHSAMQGTLEAANSLVVVGAPSVDGSSRASKTLDWLIAHGYGDLVAQSVAVISSVRPNAQDVDMNVLRNHFAARCRAVVEIPYDPHLVIGAKIDLEQVSQSASKAYLELAAAVADGFANPIASARQAP